MALESRPLSPTLQIFARLKPGVTLADANAELAVLNAHYRARHPAMLDAKKNDPEPVRLMRDTTAADQASKLWMLLGAVGLVLLIVCANVASLLLARATTRAREFAVRAAIGAGRGRIIAQLLTESLLLAIVGGALGVGLAEVSVIAIRGMTSLDLPRKSEISLDWQVLLFAAGLSVFTGLVFGLAPALAFSRPDLARVLRGSGEGGGAYDGVRHGVVRGIVRLSPRSLLVIGQVGISTVLLICAALMIQSLGAAYRVDPGFEVPHLLTMEISPSPVRYDTDQKRSTLYQQITDRIEGLPGVSSAALTMTLPMTDWAGVPVAVSGRAETRLNERPIAIYQSVTPDYFKTLHISLKRGRVFTAHDDAGSGPVVVIDENMARKFWPDYPHGVNPLGEHLLLGSHSRPTEIVGIVGDIRQDGLELDSGSGVYLASAQKPPETAMLAVRSTGDPMLLSNAVRAAILGVDPDQPVTGVSSMETLVDQAEGPLRVMMTLLTLFAAAASLVAVVGLYGVVAYSVAQRTREMGIRRALGAGRGDILRLVSGYGLRMAVGGVAVGLCCALALTRVLRGLLFAVSATDPKTYAAIAVMFVLVALLASYLPARRAAAVDPMESLRS
jgi:putative ABC transport system permease protein